MRLSLLALPLALGFAAAPAAAASPTKTATITEIVARSGGDFDHNRADYDILLNAVITADLAGALNNPAANVTVFAPNDAAFIRLARDLGYTGNSEQGAWYFLVAALTQLGGGNPVPVLTQVLLYHAAPGRYMVSQIIAAGENNQTILTLQGGTIAPTAEGFLVDAEPDLADPKLIGRANIRASNGMIQTINRVLLPINLP